MDATNVPAREMNSSKALLELECTNSTPTLEQVPQNILIKTFCQKATDAFMKRLLPESINGNNIKGCSAIDVCAKMLGISNKDDLISIIETEPWFKKTLMLEVGYKSDENATKEDVKFVGYELKQLHQGACAQAEQYLKDISGVDIFCIKTSSRSRSNLIEDITSGANSMNITEKEDSDDQSNTTKRKASDPSDANKKQKKTEAMFYETDVSNTTKRQCDKCIDDTLHKACDFCYDYFCRYCLEKMNESVYWMGYYPEYSGINALTDKDKPTHWFCTECRTQAGLMLFEYSEEGRGDYKKGKNVTCTDSKCTVKGTVLGSSGDDVLVEVAEVVKGVEESIKGLKVFDKDDLEKIR